MKNIKLTCNDGCEFIVDVEVAKCSVMIETMLENLGLDEGKDEEFVGVLLNVNGPTFQKVVEWAMHHKDDGNGADPVVLSEWDSNFMKDWDQATLFQVILAANFLDIKPLIDATCAKVKNMIVGKTPEELRAFFHRTKEIEEQGIMDDGRIRLQSSDGFVCSVDFGTAILIPKIKKCIEENGVKEGQVIPLSLDFTCLIEKVMEWVRYHKDSVQTCSAEAPNDQNNNVPQTEWDQTFLEGMDAGALFEMVLLAHHLEIEKLEKLISKKITNMIIGNSVEEIREAFHLKHDFSPEEAEFVRKENAWVVNMNP